MADAEDLISDCHGEGIRDDFLHNDWIVRFSKAPSRRHVRRLHLLTRCGSGDHDRVLCAPADRACPTSNS